MNTVLAFAAGAAAIYLPMVVVAAIQIRRFAATAEYLAQVRKYGGATAAFAALACILSGPLLVATTVLNTAPRDHS